MPPTQSTPAVSFDAPLQQATTVSVPPGGVTFDGPTSTATTVDLSQPLQSSQPASSATATAPNSPQQPATISATPAPQGIAEKVQKWADNVSYDLQHGTDLTGVGHVLKAMGAHGLYNGNSQAVGDFMGSLPLGLLKTTKGEAELPQSGKRWQGTKDIAGGLLDASTIPGSFVAPEAGEAAASATGKAGDAIAAQASRAADAVRGKLSLSSVQPELQNGIRNVLNTVAKDAGVQPSSASSIRDVASDLATGLKAKASALYKQLDAATGGGRFQRFDEQIQNIQQAIRDVTGIDPDREGALVERLNTVTDAKQKALDEAKAAGVDPKLIDKANATWKQASAIDDLSRHVRASVSGMRPELAEGKTNPETLSTAKLFPRINALFNTRRLQQALGEDKSQDLLQAVDAAHLRTLKIKATQQLAKTAAKYGAYAAGLGYAGHEAVKHLFGE